MAKPKQPKRTRDAGTGKLVSAEEAAKRPNETVAESRKNDGLAARFDLLESAILECGGPLATLYRRRKAGFVN